MGVLLGTIIKSEEALSSKVLLDVVDLMIISACVGKILDGLVIDGEVTHGGTILWGHVGNSGSISEGEALTTGSEEFNELANDTSLSEHLDNGEYHISCSKCWVNSTSELEADNLR